MDLQWNLLRKGITMECFVHRNRNGTPCSRDSQWKPLCNGFIMQTFAQGSQHGVLCRQDAQRRTFQEKNKEDHRDDIPCRRGSQGNPLHKRPTVQSYVEGNCNAISVSELFPFIILTLNQNKISFSNTLVISSFFLKYRDGTPFT